MTRVAILRAGYVALGLAFLALAGSTVSGTLLLVGLGVGFVASLLLIFSDDDLPKWSGVIILVYFVLLIISFLFATSITVRSGGRYHIEFPATTLFVQVRDWLGLAFPLLLAATAISAAWERERPARLLLIAAAAGFILVAILTVALTPTGQLAAERAQSGQRQGALIALLGAFAALAGAAGAIWSAARPEARA